MNTNGRSATWPHADLRAIRVFLILAEELHFA